MTTYNKLEQALAAARGLQSDFETFSLDTKNQQTQQMFSQLAKNIGGAVQALQTRLGFVGGEEPQYVQQSMGMDQQQQQQQQDQQQ